MSLREQPTEILLPRVGRIAPGTGRPSSSERVASHLVSRAARRLEIVCIALIAARPQTPEMLSERLTTVPLEYPWNEALAARWWETYQPSANSPTGLPADI